MRTVALLSILTMTTGLAACGQTTADLAENPDYRCAVTLMDAASVAHAVGRAELEAKMKGKASFFVGKVAATAPKGWYPKFQTENLDQARAERAMRDLNVTVPACEKRIRDELGV